MYKLLTLALSLLVSALPLNEPRRQAVSIVFTHVTVIDATGAPAKANMTVVITGDRIIALGQTGRVPIPKGAQILAPELQTMLAGVEAAVKHK